MDGGHKDDAKLNKPKNDTYGILITKANELVKFHRNNLEAL